MNATRREDTGITARPPRVLLRGSGDPGPAVVVYRLESGPHRQTGVVVEVSIDDYRGGRIRRHEATQPARVRELEEQAEATGVERMPVMLVHRGHLPIADLTAETPTARMHDGGATHTVWIRRDEAGARALCDEIGRIGNLYIADGHHRMLAADRYAARRGLGSGHPSAFTLAALFPSDEMRILGYHRCFALAPGSTARDVLDRLAEHPLTERIEESPAADTEPGVVAIGVGDRWYRLRLRASGVLDAFAIEQELLPKLHDLTAAEADAAPGRQHAVETCWCDGRNAFRLIPHPPTIDQVLTTSDEGRPMPPKSTWFDPKPTAQLFRRPLI
ncbi:Uncharacterized conserved protein, DUF1015 family [Saccharopolyspora shandongensis]|uniref:Uncharacterized conserved protein, DUF1015 family n=1 Tax=Saccharopolyspora shandongensis TaxID=418495 RepID=A0A1H3SGS0_9PSEU|nr:DUF1015 family protein [Saccharopolyspora shandongensis]SDZ36751.1 Uncharacterized conserved protein, DUF1015 family [Saccharopolyspora shandongensis]